MEACCCNLEVDVNGEETFMVDKVTLSLSSLLLGSTLLFLKILLLVLFQNFGYNFTK